MNFRRFLIGLLCLAVFLITVNVYSPALVAQNRRSAHSKKPAQFHYVCPMHEEVTSKSRGICHKCKMKLVRKPLPQKPSQ